MEIAEKKFGEMQNTKEKWKEITKTCTEPAEEIIGYKNKNKKSQNEEIEDLSKKQKKLRNNINACTEKRDRKNLKQERNMILNEIHKKLQQQEKNRITEKIEQIEKYKNDSNRMFQVVREV